MHRGRGREAAIVALILDTGPFYAVAERLQEPKLATLDHRHFLLRPRHVESLRLLPSD